MFSRSVFSRHPQPTAGPGVVTKLDGILMDYN